MHAVPPHQESFIYISTFALFAEIHSNPVMTSGIRLLYPPKTTFCTNSDLYSGLWKSDTTPVSSFPARTVPFIGPAVPHKTQPSINPPFCSIYACATNEPNEWPRSIIFLPGKSAFAFSIISARSLTTASKPFFLARSPNVPVPFCSAVNAVLP